MRSVCRSENGSPVGMPQLRLDFAAALMPHPEKVSRGGEDAVFLAEDRLAFGETIYCTVKLILKTSPKLQQQDFFCSYLKPDYVSGCTMPFQALSSCWIMMR